MKKVVGFFSFFFSFPIEGELSKNFEINVKISVHWSIAISINAC